LSVCDGVLASSFASQAPVLQKHGCHFLDDLMVVDPKLCRNSSICRQQKFWMALLPNREAAAGAFC